MSPAVPTYTSSHHASGTIHTFTLDCGATLIVQPMDTVASAALNWALPAGACTDPPDGDGQAALLSELLLRGAGDRTSRALSDALDALGVERSLDVLTHHLRLEAITVGANLHQALPLLCDIITRPALPQDHLDAVRSLCLQSLESIDDDPQHRVMIGVRERHLPPPYNRHGYGDRAVLERATVDELRAAWKSRGVPGGSIIAVAGRCDPLRLVDDFNRLLAGWSGAHGDPGPSGPGIGGIHHIMHSTAQVHLAVAHAAPREAHADALLERLAITILGGSTSGRLFTEVRQKRALCYSVGASYRSGRDSGFVTTYAGTTPERAQQTIDICIAEMKRLREGVTEAEFKRAVIGLKSHLVMQGESTPSRAMALVHDYFRLGRARTLDDLTAEIDALSVRQVNEYLQRRAVGPLTMVSIGPNALTAPTTIDV